MTDVLVVEDDPAIRRGLVDALSYAGHDVRQTDDGLEALRLVEHAVPDLVLLDVMLPGADGFEVLAGIRDKLPGLPVIMVTARGSEEDRVRGLKNGADDYVVKPFSAKELLARVEAVLRRAPERPKGIVCFSLGGRRIDLRARRVTLPDGATVDLSERETGLLAHLASASDRPVTREELLERVWGLDPKGLHTRTVDMHVARLRDKLADERGEPRLLMTVHGAGYRLGVIEVLPT